MKCQKCEKAATFHITELEKGSVRELHLCEDHARAYLNQSEAAGGEPAEKEGGKSVGEILSNPLGVGQTADELALLDQKSCPHCEITFFEFRNQGRLGCPHDYVCFEKELEPLIANIHGSTEHTGRRPSRSPEGTEWITRVIGMRREIKDAISREDYERAKDLRDSIREIEDRAIGGGGKRFGIDAAPGTVPSSSSPVSNTDDISPT